LILRALVLLLLCMNIGVAAWWASQRERTTAPAPATDPNVPPLVLLAEVERRPLSDAAELAEAPAELSPDAVCLSIGPFSTPSELRLAMDLMLPRVERIQFREVPAVALRGYRVYLPPAANRAEALQTARALSARGIADYYVVTAGDQQNTVSLGIFRELENATARRDVVAALGYSPVVEPRTEQVPQWWIDLAAPPGLEWRGVLPDPALQGQAARCQ
jgi:hypothetical protein